MSGKYKLKSFADVTEEEMSDGSDEASTSRAGRFRVSSAPSGPPETTLGRFRLIPQGLDILQFAKQH